MWVGTISSTFFLFFWGYLALYYNIFYEFLLILGLKVAYCYYLITLYSLILSIYCLDKHQDYIFLVTLFLD